MQLYSCRFAFLSLVVVVAVVTVTVTGVGGSVIGGVGQNGQDSSDHCRKKAKNVCQNASLEKGQTTLTCFGVPLPYIETSNELVNSNFTQQQIKTELIKWETGLRSLPKCWNVVQEVLCFFYMPKCEEGMIDLAPQEVCKRARNPCRVIEESLKEWPDFLKCEDPDKFAPDCKTSMLRTLTFNKSLPMCSYPLIAVESKESKEEPISYDGFEGCALGCKDHSFSDEDHESVAKLIKYLGIVTLAATGIVIGTFIIDWHSSSTYPSIIVFYVNCCYFLATIGWMVQFLPNAKEDIVCRKDLTIRRREFDSRENVFCILVFIVIYYCSMAALAWLVVFAYVWNLTCHAVGRIRERIDKQSICFHFLCWLTPLVLTVVCVSLRAVDGNSLTGICYVSYSDSVYRITLVLIPIALAAAVMLFYLWRGIYRLLSVSVSSSDFISSRGRAEIKSNALRVGFFTVVAVILVITFICLQAHEMQMRSVWAKSKRDHLVCNLNLTAVAECEIEQKPSVAFINWSIVMFFGGGLLVSTWAWTGASFRTWRRFITRRFKSENSLDQQAHPAKHKLISQAFAKRHQLPVKGRLSLSLYSTHEDPIGLNKLLDPNHLCHNGEDTELQTHNNLNSEAHEEISSEWAAAIPHLVTRRGALVPPHSSNNSVSCVSTEDSRRPSCDSAMSEAAIRNLNGGYDYEIKKSRRRGLFNMGRRSRNGKNWSTGWRRRHAQSSSSLESNQGSQILPAITALIDKRIRRNDDDSLTAGTAMNTLLNNANPPMTSPTARRPILMKELAVQTSLEKLSTPLHGLGMRGNTKACNLSNNLTADKATQYSLVNLHEIGTQTKKSATKKRDREGKEKSSGRDRSEKNHKTDKDNKDKEENNRRDEQEDPVLKLLTPI